MTSKTVPSIPAWSRQRDQGNLWYIAQVSITIPNYVNVSLTGCLEDSLVIAMLTTTLC